MLQRVSGEECRASNIRGPTSWPRNIRPTADRISFRELAKLAFPSKTAAALVHVTGKSESTVKYWLADKHEPPASVLCAVLGEIMRRAGIT